MIHPKCTISGDILYLNDKWYDLREDEVKEWLSKLKIKCINNTLVFKNEKDLVLFTMRFDR